MVSDIGAVVVTFNRLEKLKKALASYEKQTLLPEYIIVVDNASNDGTKEYLEEWKKENREYEKIVVSLSENKGGAGGFYEGQKAAITKDAAWIMHADDDLYFDKDYFSGINNFIKAHNSDEYSIICGKIIEHEKISIGHRLKMRSKWTIPFCKYIKKENYEKESFCCDMVSYCGIALNKEKLIKAGLVNPECFIWLDDWEHTYRMKTTGQIVCLTNVSANHDTEIVPAVLTWKLYYSYRNGIKFLKTHFKFQFPYLLLLLLCKTLLSPLKGTSFEEVKMRLTGIKDGVFGNMGKHSIYCPGWKSKAYKK